MQIASRNGDFIFLISFIASRMAPSKHIKRSSLWERISGWPFDLYLALHEKLSEGVEEPNSWQSKARLLTHSPLKLHVCILIFLFSCWSAGIFLLVGYLIIKWMRREDDGVFYYYHQASSDDFFSDASFLWVRSD
jgi:hypothetical protein